MTAALTLPPRSVAGPRSGALHRFAADRRIDVVTAPLTSAEAVWLPGDRLVVVADRLTGEAYDRALEHELHHALADDTHLLLDDRVPTHEQRLLTRRPSAPRRRRDLVAVVTVALLALAAGRAVTR